MANRGRHGEDPIPLLVVPLSLVDQNGQTVPGTFPDTTFSNDVFLNSVNDYYISYDTNVDLSYQQQPFSLYPSSSGATLFTSLHYASSEFTSYELIPTPSSLQNVTVQENTVRFTLKTSSSKSPSSSRTENFCQQQYTLKR